MTHLSHVTDLPANFPEFIHEVADSMEAMYGPEASAHYQSAAVGQFQGALRHPSVDMLGWFEGEEALGLLATVQRGLVTQFSFLHVLSRCAGRKIEQRLVTDAIRIHRAGGVDAILAEYLQFTPLDDGPAYEAAGFECVERELMAASLPLSAPTRDSQTNTTTLFAENDWVTAATVIVDAYEGHPGQRLHIEVRDAENALGFIQAVADSSYGPSRPEYHRMLRENGHCDGVIVGCEVAPRIGFILQVAVRPTSQNRGLGSRLVRELSQSFCEAGCAKVVLGVTSDSPARRLYERLGFRRMRTVNAYVWWRP
jgi:ribosomal protein S18 acetylase RimI-like enzyme